MDCAKSCSLFRNGLRVASLAYGPSSLNICLHLPLLLARRSKRISGKASQGCQGASEVRGKTSAYKKNSRFSYTPEAGSKGQRRAADEQGLSGASAV